MLTGDDMVSLEGNDRVVLWASAVFAPTGRSKSNQPVQVGISSVTHLTKPTKGAAGLGMHQVKECPDPQVNLEFGLFFQAQRIRLISGQQVMNPVEVFLLESQSE